MAFIELNDEFLASLGLDSLPEDYREALLRHIYSVLEERLGTQLAEGMKDSQLEEFEAIIDGDTDVIEAWIASYAPDHSNDELYVRMRDKLDTDDETAIRAEYAGVKWLAINRPDYEEMIRQTADELKAQIAEVRDEILASAK